MPQQSCHRPILSGMKCFMFQVQSPRPYITLIKQPISLLGKITKHLEELDPTSEIMHLLETSRSKLLKRSRLKQTRKTRGKVSEVQHTAKVCLSELNYVPKSQSSSLHQRSSLGLTVLRTSRWSEFRQSVSNQL